ncbi:MAG: VOC family protein [Candidatus Eremiobacteraeota bacterium]|nr:VOC family protein [Candidatus Eremiobacteraeota bacterium]
MRAFFAVANLEQARAFYDVLLGQSGILSPGRLAYVVEGFKLDFYQLTPEQSREFQLGPGTPGGCGLCLNYRGPLEQLEGEWLRPMGPTEWGARVGHLLDPFGYRWEIMG